MGMTINKLMQMLAVTSDGSMMSTAELHAMAVEQQQHSRQAQASGANNDNHDW